MIKILILSNPFPSFLMSNINDQAFVTLLSTASFVFYNIPIGIYICMCNIHINVKNKYINVKKMRETKKKKNKKNISTSGFLSVCLIRFHFAIKTVLSYR